MRKAKAQVNMYIENDGIETLANDLAREIGCIIEVSSDNDASNMRWLHHNVWQMSIAIQFDGSLQDVVDKVTSVLNDDPRIVYWTYAEPVYNWWVAHESRDWFIYNQATGMYWSFSYGWGGIENRDRFSDAEKKHVMMSGMMPSQGKWMIKRGLHE